MTPAPNSTSSMSLNGASLAGSLGIGEECADGLRDDVQLLLGNARIDGKGQQFVGERLGDGERSSSVGDPPECCREVGRFGIVLRGRYSAFGEEVPQLL